MEFVVACLASFLLGSWTVILAQRCSKNVSVEKNEEKQEENTNRREAKLSEQWNNFFNYTGNEQTGGDEQ